MKRYSFHIVIEKEPEDEGYFAYSPTLPGCFSSGRTVEEAKRHFREAIEQHLCALLDRAEAVPDHSSGQVHVEEMTVEVPD